ncbi:hypothetical protein GCM10023085_72900 [Actinomadura viridis]|uniref:Phage shock protein PspC (Stress-responsive transcriptional regulator) n=1 Tax=Actinomadura viridis TaxID=58110 RepID=A0A931DSC9_9ACTN|nr:PspC domain-containing protein [Actinomadura viridis]MBG6092951.1 phage shock protein PspC (stress-responsive transcriptional regulator) [Actinomadura viridis]
MDMEKSTTKQLRRTREGRMIAGVCSGTGRYLGVDPNLLRLGLAVFTVFGGAGIVLYAIAWLLIPEEGKPSSVAEDLFTKANANPSVQEAVRKTKETISKTTSGNGTRT